MNKTESVAESFNALLKGDIERAVSLSSDCSGSEGSLYQRDTVSLVRTILEDDYTPDSRLKERVLTPLRIVAAAIELWGEEEATQYAEVTGTWDYRYDANIALKLLHAAGLEKHRLDSLAAMGVTKVKATFPETLPLCPACRAVQSKVFSIAEAPSLPLAECQSDTPCIGHYSGSVGKKQLLS